MNSKRVVHVTVTAAASMEKVAADDVGGRVTTTRQASVPTSHPIVSLCK